jgi:hypothetical protein
VRGGKKKRQLVNRFFFIEPAEHRQFQLESQNLSGAGVAERSI